MTDDEIPLWIYYNLGSSSFFNNLFDAAEFFLRDGAAAEMCPTCEHQPCMALNQTLPPYWITSMLHPPANTNPTNRRFQCYRKCHPQYGHARVPLPDCWVLAIRICHPGDHIVGFRPRYLPKPENQQPVVVIQNQAGGRRRGRRRSGRNPRRRIVWFRHEWE